MCWQTIQWMLQHDQFMPSEQLQTSLECCAEVLQNPQLTTVLGHKDQTTWTCAIINAVHKLLSASKCYTVNKASLCSLDHLGVCHHKRRA